MNSKIQSNQDLPICQSEKCPDKNCVSKVPIFNHLEADQMSEIKDLTQSISLKKRDILYRAGDTSDSLYIVNSGRLRLYSILDSGKERLLQILHPGEFTGELALFDESLHEVYAEAMEDTAICILKQSKLNNLMLKYPTIAIKILTELANRLKRSEAQATLFAIAKVETRIALYLIDCLKDVDHIVDEVTIPLSKKDLASYLGTTPETISRKLLFLEENNYIVQKNGRRIQILDRDGLLSLES